MPDDAYNRALIGHVHPSDWVNPTPAGRYNMVVLGAGTAGLVTAAGAAALGARVAIVERHLMGGDCLNVGCVPSKALLHSARRAAAGTSIEFGAAMARMRRLRAGIAPHDSAVRFRELGVDVFLGDARFTGTDSVSVGGESLRFSRAVIATGARAAVPDIPGIDATDYLTNESVFTLTEMPRRLLVLGGGPIGCELAQAFQRLGSQVTIVTLDDQLLSREDAEASAIVQRSLLSDGVTLALGASVSRVEQRSPSDRVIIADLGGRREEFVGDALLVATGRAANVEGLDLSAAGVHSSRHGVTVDDRLRTSNRRIFAAGDVCSRYKFTHAADAMARVAVQNALFFGRKRAGALVIPWATYTSPELAHVGISSADAGTRDDVVTLTEPLSGVDRAVLDDERDGFARVHVDAGSGRILGATMVASHAGDLIGEMALAMTNDLRLADVAGTIHPYPTQSEAWKKLGDQWNRRRLTPFVHRLTSTWLRWRR
jgi:pyruvate/2-oxoglutarate dehydrogenase complex dihydrolipoamide dehydrogenase (E3) component